ncbi:hypothetical protein [Actinokineospora globicatena]|uniref:Uncharacterized protein n=1 Tax=Actinokineospora globicatena TaxID=103729 RepID=A0A9W6V855_9PSEU|nr:hypothetical protein [Actinokineospora globicatena]GLW89613.1 hypothetical protein Aglo03_04290 [Actinokineospora globicatena]
MARTGADGDRGPGVLDETGDDVLGVRGGALEALAGAELLVAALGADLPRSLPDCPRLDAFDRSVPRTDWAVSLTF